MTNDKNSCIISMIYSTPELKYALRVYLQNINGTLNFKISTSIMFLKADELSKLNKNIYQPNPEKNSDNELDWSNCSPKETLKKGFSQQLSHFPILLKSYNMRRTRPTKPKSELCYVNAWIKNITQLWLCRHYLVLKLLNERPSSHKSVWELVLESPSSIPDQKLLQLLTTYL